MAGVLRLLSPLRPLSSIPTQPTLNRSRSINTDVTSKLSLKKRKRGFYAVQKGRNVGVFNTWDECEVQTKGYQGAKYKKFDSLAAAEQFAFPEATLKTPNSLTSLIPVPVIDNTLNDCKEEQRNFHTLVAHYDNQDRDIVYSDGACKGNGCEGSVAGIGVWWGHSDNRNLAERCPGDQTNNRAELIAILRVMETIPRAAKKSLLIRTDSQYAIKCLGDWIQTWKKNNWKNSKKEYVKNADIIRCISLHFELRSQLGHKVDLEYVMGHSGDEGNDGADLMANIGATMSVAAERDWNALEKELEEELALQLRALSVD